MSAGTEYETCSARQPPESTSKRHKRVIKFIQDVKFMALDPVKMADIGHCSQFSRKSVTIEAVLRARGICRHWLFVLLHVKCIYSLLTL